MEWFFLACVAFTYAPGRSGQYADDILEGFTGILQVDGYAGYNRLIQSDRIGNQAGPIKLAYCWAHARRKLFEIAQTTTAPIAQEGLKRIDELIRSRLKSVAYPQRPASQYGRNGQNH